MKLNLRQNLYYNIREGIKGVDLLKMLVFEFATALGLDDPPISVEGGAMLYAILDDLKGRKVDYLISKKSEPAEIAGKAILLTDGLTEWIDANIGGYDACLPIAPEEDMVLYQITKSIEEKGITIIGSSSDAVLTCSDKFRLYETLKNKVPIIETERVFFEDIDRYRGYFKNSRDKVIKPADGVSCSGVHVVSSFGEFKGAASSMDTVVPYLILQDFVAGTPVSMSLLSNGKKALPLSLNLQDISISAGKIEYKGGYIPLESEFAEEAEEIAKKSVESIKGLKGYVGVDLILAEEVHLVEINSRITTPYVALKNILNFNLGEAMIDACQGRLPEEVVLDGRVAFKKKGSSLEIIKATDKN